MLLVCYLPSARQNIVGNQPGETYMEKNDLPVEDNPQGRDLVQDDEGHGQNHHHNPVGENPPEQIHDDRVFSFRNGIR